MAKQFLLATVLAASLLPTAAQAAPKDHAVPAAQGGPVSPADIAKLRADMAALGQQIDTLAQGSQVDPAVIADIQARLAAAEKNVAALSNRVGSAETRLADAAAVINTLADRVLALEKAVLPGPDPTLTISATPSTVVAGGVVSIGWEALNVIAGDAACTASGAWTGPRKAKDSLDVTPLVSVVYMLQCAGLNGKSVIGSAAVTVTAAPPPPSAMGPLTHPPGNNYFVKPDGAPVLLTGSHTWNNLQDEGATFPPASLDYAGYLNWMQSNTFNFMRLWNIGEQPYSAPWAAVWYIDPQPYTRTGPGNAADGKPKFDLTKLNQSYFDRMRARVIAAGQKGVYADVMLFEGWSIGPVTGGTNPWTYHPFNVKNNINGIDGDPSNTGNGYAIQTASAPAAVLAAQQAYVRKVIDTVGDLDNVLYEISNESQPTSAQWQYDMINYIKSYEAGKPKQHPVGMSAVGCAGCMTDNAAIINSPADWVSPGANAGGYKDNPTANNGAKVVVNDTDHLWGGGGSADWVWKSFTRGLNPIFMDDLDNTGISLGGRAATFDPAWYTTRAGMTQVAAAAAKIDLKKVKPHGELTSTTYALADPCNQYLVYGTGGGFTVNLSACTGVGFDASWSDLNGKAYPATQVNGGTNANLTPPFSGSSVLLLTKSSVVPPPVISPDGSVLAGGQTGTLTTTLGVWTWGTTSSAGNWNILLNGRSTAGTGSRLQVDRGGKLYTLGTDRSWYVATGSASWAKAIDPNLPPPPPPPPPQPPLPPGNSMLLQNVSGALVQNYLWQIGRPFVCGEIAHYPQVVLNGQSISTQADVKNRCPDGSVKFAVIAAVIPQLPVDTSQIVTFQDQTSSNNTPISTADLLTQFPDFDATIKISGAAVGAKSSVSARQMLADGNCKPWTSGPVAQTMICADRSAARTYDMGSDKWRSLHPEFIVTFWPATKQVFVRYVGEISNSQALEAFPCDLELTAGKANPVSVYKQANVTHSIATRWTRTTWLGGTPESKIAINHNRLYLSATKYIANYRPDSGVVESTLADWYDRFMKSDRSINGLGLWKPDMPGVGYHPEIGPMPVWYVDYVYSGDWRARDVMLGQADLVGLFGLQIREGDPARFMDRAKTVPALGRTVGVYGRPLSWGLDYRENPNPDTIIVRSAPTDIYRPDLYNWHGTETDEAHEPDPFFVPYILTGDPYYLDGLQLWAGLNSLYLNPDCIYRCGALGVISTQVRGNAWELRNRRHAWAASPDDDPMKAAFAAMLDDALAWWEGQRDIRGTQYENTPAWKQTHQYFAGGLPPLHLWQGGESNEDEIKNWGEWFDLTVTKRALLPWHADFLLLELGRTVEMGFDGAKGNFAYLGKYLIGKLTDPGYRIQTIGMYLEPAQKQPNGAFFETFPDLLRGWSPAVQTQLAPLYYPATGTEIYWDVAHGAAALTATLPGGAVAWQRWQDALIQMSKDLGAAPPTWDWDPTWAIVPRNGQQ